jgi:uncharacterized tellurite resistance protein B-like protein
MTNIKNSNIAYLFYAVGTIDYISANYFNNDLTGMPFSPIIFGGIGSIFMFVHNSKIKESNNNVYELFKFALFAVLISDDIIDESELEYSSSILNTLENELLLPTNPTKLEQEILNYDLNNIYEKIQNLEPSIAYKTKLNILSSCAILCVMDGQIDDVEQESIYKISNILNISENDMKNIFNASIASYIDFKNSDREKLKINDSEVKKVVEEKKAENKSNKNQIYTGIGLFVVLGVFGIYSSFQVTIEESCENIRVFYNEQNDLEDNFLPLNNDSVDIWNSLIEIMSTDDYINLSSNEQLALHESLNLYKIKDHAQEINKIINIKLTQDINAIEIHDDHQVFIKLFNDYKLYEIKRMEIAIYNHDLNIEYIQTIETYYKDWDNAFKDNNNNLLNSLTSDFKNYDLEHDLLKQENNEPMSGIVSNLDASLNQLEVELVSKCDFSFTNEN